MRAPEGFNSDARKEAIERAFPRVVGPSKDGRISVRGADGSLYYLKMHHPTGWLLIERAQ